MIRKNGGKETETEYFAALVRVLWDRINKISRISLVYCRKGCNLIRAGARTLIGGGGGIFIYSGSARLVSFVIKLISKEINRA